MSDDQIPRADANDSRKVAPRATVGGEIAAATPVVDIADIVGAGREAHILHDGQIYRLRITSNRKLILTK